MIKKIIIIIILNIFMLENSKADSKISIANIIDFEVVSQHNLNDFYYVYDKSNPIITIDLAFKNAGYAIDDKKKLGLSYILLYFFKNQEITSNPNKLKEFIEEKGIHIDFHIDSENFYISIKSISFYLDDLIKIINEFLLVEIFNEKFLDQFKENLKQIYQANLGNASFKSQLGMNELLFKNSDLSKNPYGDEKTLKNITIDDLQSLVQTRFLKKNLNMAISGNISKKNAKNLYQEISDNLRNNNNLSFNKNVVDRNEITNIPLEKQQIIVRTYAKSIAKNNVEFYKYYLANYIIGGSGLNSILSQTIREKNGLTYSIHSYFEDYNDFSVWICEFSTDKEKYNQAINILKKEFVRISKEGIDDVELNRAKKFLLGNFAIYFNSNSNISSYLLDARLKNIPLDNIKNRNKTIMSFTKEEINEAIKDLLNSKKLSYLSVGNYK